MYNASISVPVSIYQRVPVLLRSIFNLYMIYNFGAFKRGVTNKEQISTFVINNSLLNVDLCLFSQLSFYPNNCIVINKILRICIYPRKIENYRSFCQNQGCDVVNQYFQTTQNNKLSSLQTSVCEPQLGLLDSNILLDALQIINNGK